MDDRFGVGDVRAGRFLVASLSVAVGCGALAYWVSGALTPATGSLPNRPWHLIVLPPDMLAVAGVAAVVVGACGLLAVLVWARKHQLNPAGELLTAGFALAGALTGAVLEIVSAPTWTPAYAKIAGASAMVAWLGVLVGCCMLMKPRRGTTTPCARGCSYCSVDVHLLAGDVQQVAIRDDQQAVLLRCPRCGWLYQAPLTEDRIDPKHLTEAQAREIYAFP